MTQEPNDFREQLVRYGIDGTPGGVLRHFKLFAFVDKDGKHIPGGLARSQLADFFRREGVADVSAADLERMEVNATPLPEPLRAYLSGYYNQSSLSEMKSAWSSSATMRSCPKYDSCSAPVCPLDPNYQKSVHLPGERVCLYLREAVKPGGKAILRESCREDIAEGVLRVVPDVLSSVCTLKSALDRAKNTPSKLAQARHLRRSKAA